jgi:aspartyl/glutamyl-tRNA(Asn/Gln) amidotransferase C subunit
MDRQELITTAHLALLEVSETEMTRLEEEVDRMLEYFSQMKDLEIEDPSPVDRPAPENRLRKDAVRPARRDAETAETAETADSGAELLNNAPEREERFISIPNVL